MTNRDYICGIQALRDRGLNHRILTFEDFEECCKRLHIAHEFYDLATEKGCFLWDTSSKDPAKIILLNPSLSEWELRVVAFHELAHALAPLESTAALEVACYKNHFQLHYNDDYEKALLQEHEANILAALAAIPRAMIHAMTNKEIRRAYGYPRPLVKFRRRIFNRSCNSRWE